MSDYVWRSEDNLCEFVFSLYHVSPEDQAQMLGARTFTHWVISPADKYDSILLFQVIRHYWELTLWTLGL